MPKIAEYRVYDNTYLYVYYRYYSSMQGSVVAAADASQTHRPPPWAACRVGSVGRRHALYLLFYVPCVYMAEGSSRGTLSRKEREITLPRTSNNYFVIVFIIDQKCVSHSEQKEVFVSISHF